MSNYKSQILKNLIRQYLLIDCDISIYKKLEKQLLLAYSLKDSHSVKLNGDSYLSNKVIKLFNFLEIKLNAHNEKESKVITIDLPTITESFYNLHSIIDFMINDQIQLKKDKSKKPKYISGDVLQLLLTNKWEDFKQLNDFIQRLVNSINEKDEGILHIKSALQILSSSSFYNVNFEEAKIKHYYYNRFEYNLTISKHPLLVRTLVENYLHTDISNNPFKISHIFSIKKISYILKNVLELFKLGINATSQNVEKNAAVIVEIRKSLFQLNQKITHNCWLGWDYENEKKIFNNIKSIKAKYEKFIYENHYNLSTKEDNYILERHYQSEQSLRKFESILVTEDFSKVWLFGEEISLNVTNQLVLKHIFSSGHKGTTWNEINNLLSLEASHRKLHDLYRGSKRTTAVFNNLIILNKRKYFMVEYIKFIK